MRKIPEQLHVVEIFQQQNVSGWMARDITRNTGNMTSARETLADNFTIKKEAIMLYTIAVVLIILWLLGLVSSYTMGGFIHLLLVIAIVVVLLRIISGRKPL